MNITTLPKKKRKQGWFSKYATEVYYDLVGQQEARCEAYAIGYPTEIKRFYSEIEKRITFKDVLLMLKGTQKPAMAA